MYINKEIVIARSPKKYREMMEKAIESAEYDSDGYWAYTYNGYNFRLTGCHTLHEETLAGFLKEVRDIFEVDESDDPDAGYYSQGV